MSLTQITEGELLYLKLTDYDSKKKKKTCGKAFTTIPRRQLHSRSEHQRPSQADKLTIITAVAGGSQGNIGRVEPWDLENARRPKQASEAPNILKLCQCI